MTNQDIKLDAKINKYNHPWLFFALSTLLPWGFWGVAAYLSHLEPASSFHMKWASFLGLVGLLMPAVIAFWLIHRDIGLQKDLFSRFFNFKSAKPVYLLLALFLMPASILLAQAVSLLFGYSASQFQITGHYTFTSGVFPVWFLLILAPVIEELGWHTYGTDSLRNRFSLFKTSMFFALYWGIWHIPLSFIKDYYQSHLVALGWIHSLNFLVSIFPFVIIMNWLYYKTNRNILVAIVFHITAGYFNEIFATHPDSKVIQTVILLIFSTFIVVKNKSFYFSKEIRNVQ